ncbi:acyl-CoA dehydrogenase family protein [Saccharomonospora sp. NPDC006951]
MRLVASEQDDDLTTMMRKLFAAECPAGLVRELGANRFPARLWRALTEAGLFGLAFAGEHGGADGTLPELGLCFQEAGRALCPTIVTSTVLFGLGVDRLGDAGQRSRYLTPLAEGKLRATTALWDAADASAAPPPGVRAAPAKSPGTWTVEGTLDWVADIGLAEVLLVAATVTEPGEPRRTVALVVDTSADGVAIEARPTRHGAWHRVVLSGVEVPAIDVMAGEEGNGLPAEKLRALANTAVALSCLDLVGGAEAVLAATVEYTTTRHQFGRPIAGFQAAQHIVADMHIALGAARLAARSAVFWLGKGRCATRETAIARMHAASACRRITLDAHQLHGGMGYVLDTDLHLWSERARSLGTFGGSADTAAGWLRGEAGLD